MNETLCNPVEMADTHK